MKVCILLSEQLSLFEMACAVELFALPRPEIHNWYETVLVSLANSKFESLCGTTFNCKQVSLLPQSDLLVIPSFPLSVSQPDKHLINEIKRHYQNGGRVISFCSGSFFISLCRHIKWASRHNTLEICRRI